MTYVIRYSSTYRAAYVFQSTHVVELLCVKVQCLSKAYKYPSEVQGFAGGSVLKSVRPVIRVDIGKLPRASISYT